jgi:REP-associated tyrosine transposase
VRYVRKNTHAKFDLKYHIVWTCKYRYPILQGRIATRVRALIRQIAAENEVAILAGSISPRHLHMLVSVPPNLAPAKLVQYLKGVTSRKLQMEFPELKKRYWGQHLWARGYFVASSGNVTDEVIKNYIEHQQDEDEAENFKITK